MTTISSPRACDVRKGADVSSLRELAAKVLCQLIHYKKSFPGSSPTIERSCLTLLVVARVVSELFPSCCLWEPSKGVQ